MGYNAIMDQGGLGDLLSDLPLGAVRYLSRVGSTNDLAARWVADGASDLSLVVADEQTAGRGRLKRRWFTPAGSGLAFSLILKEIKRDKASPVESIAHYTGLGALAVSDVLNEMLPEHHAVQIKWPNDVLAGPGKIAGVLAEAQWHGDQLTSVILGIGINIAPESVPPAEDLNFPATCVEDLLARPVDRWLLLHAVLDKLLNWRLYLGAPKLIQAWERRLAYLGEWVQVFCPDNTTVKDGQLLGINRDGSLRLRDGEDIEYSISVGEIGIRPVDLSEKSTKLIAKQ